MDFLGSPVIGSSPSLTWRKFCGFLDFSLEEFMSVQDALLSKQLEVMVGSPLGQKIIGKNAPKNVEEFRRNIPITTYADYLTELDYGNGKNGHSLPVEPYAWAHTSNNQGSLKWVPYTKQAYDTMLENVMSVTVLACSRKTGESSFSEGDHILFNVAPKPYLSGLMADSAFKKYNVTPLMSPKMQQEMDFRQKIKQGFELSLTRGVDILFAMTSVLVKMGYDMGREANSDNARIKDHMANPGALYPLARAWIRSRFENRKILPKDLWPVKALIGWGIDTDILKEQIYKYWGIYPYQFHACTEAGVVAMQSWNRKGMVFQPYSNFFEFIPEDELLKCRENPKHKPATVLMSEVESGKRYELVISSFNGMPFIRYRLGHLISITALADEDAHINIPHMAFEGRADEVIDIAGFARLSEKTIAQAIADTDLGCVDWVARKEFKDGQPKLHLYMELSDTNTPAEAGYEVHSNLKTIDPFYSDLDSMMEIKPVEVTLLRPGTYSDFYTQKFEGGSDLYQRKPSRMSSSQEVIETLIEISTRERLSGALGR